MRSAGESTTKIARTLRKEKVLIPSQYAAEKGYKKPAIKVPRDKYLWDHTIIRKILMNQSYVGDVINFKTSKMSFKLKKQINNLKENQEIYQNIHESIIERDIFENIQKSFGQTKYRKPKNVPKNMFSGLVKCSDCNANLNFKLHQNPINNFFSCYNKRQQNGLCNKTHHIRVDMLTQNIESRARSH